MNAPTKVLIADDDELVAQLVQEKLTAEGYEIVHAADGEAALRLAAAERPAIIVLDLNMPGLDGMEVLSRLQENANTRAVPVIMLTARKFEGDVVKARTLGARDYMLKPFTPEELLKRIQRILGAPAGI